MNNTEMIMVANNLKANADWHRFNQCNAYTSQNMDGKTLIRSYNTVVGIADDNTKTVYEFGKYSRTTSKQFSQICNQCFRGYARVNVGVTNW